MIAKLWIRVNARLADDADVRAFARKLLPNVPAWLAVEAGVGLLVTLWGRAIDEQEDGDIGGRDDDVLEEWAKWRGEPGAFASAFRAAFAPAGKIVLWDEYQGPLIARRKLDRERKRQRGGRDPRAEVAADSTGESDADLYALPHAIPQEGPPDVVRNSNRNGDGDGNGESELPHRSPSPREFDAVGALLSAIPSRQRLAWEAEINAAPQGMHGAPLTTAQVEQAARDFVGNGGLSGRPSLSHFRGYLKRAAKPDSAPVPRFTRPTKQEQGRANLAAAMQRRAAQGVNDGK